jgi:hypothetical protein
LNLQAVRTMLEEAEAFDTPYRPDLRKMLNTNV